MIYVSWNDAVAYAEWGVNVYQLKLNGSMQPKVVWKAIYWDSKSQDGEWVASGVYFYSIEMGEESQTRWMVILK